MSEAKKQPTKGTPGRAEFRPDRYEVRSPVPDFSGNRFGVYLGGGVGRTSDRVAALNCHYAGYEVIDLETGGKIDPAAVIGEDGQSK